MEGATSSLTLIFLDSDLLPKFGEKPEQYKFSGQRITRGTYKTARGWIVSADANGAANILRKVAIQLKITLAEVGRGILAVPKRYDLSCLRKSYRKRSEAVFLTPVATSV